MGLEVFQKGATPRLLEWTRKALKETHEAKTSYHNNAIKELQTRYSALQKRLDAIYEDKLDGVITREVYDQKSATYREEQNEITQQLKRYEQASDAYQDIGISLLELAEKAKEIYQILKEKGDTEKQRLLLSYAYGALSLLDGRLKKTYTLAFQLAEKRAQEYSKLPKSLQMIPKNFEPQKILDNKGQTAPLRGGLRVMSGLVDDVRNVILGLPQAPLMNA